MDDTYCTACGHSGWSHGDQVVRPPDGSPCHAAVGTKMKDECRCEAFVSDEPAAESSPGVERLFRNLVDGRTVELVFHPVHGVYDQACMQLLVRSERGIPLANQGLVLPIDDAETFGRLFHYATVMAQAGLPDPVDFAHEVVFPASERPEPEPEPEVKPEPVTFDQLLPPEPVPARRERSVLPFRRR